MREGATHGAWSSNGGSQATLSAPLHRANRLSDALIVGCESYRQGQSEADFLRADPPDGSVPNSHGLLAAYWFEQSQPNTI